MERKSGPGTVVYTTGGFLARPFPGSALESIYPCFTTKRLLRHAFDLRPPNPLLDLAIGTPLFRALALTVSFHDRGLLAGATWGDLATSTGRR